MLLLSDQWTQNAEKTEIVVCIRDWSLSDSQTGAFRVTVTAYKSQYINLPAFEWY